LCWMITTSRIFTDETRVVDRYLCGEATVSSFPVDK